MTSGVGEIPSLKLLFTPPGTSDAASATRWDDAVKVIIMLSSRCWSARQPRATAMHSISYRNPCRHPVIVVRAGNGALKYSR